MSFAKTLSIKPRFFLFAVLILISLPGYAAVPEKSGPLKMEGTVSSEDGSGSLSAIINGELAAPGAVIAGYEILTVEDRGVSVKELATDEVKFVETGDAVGLPEVQAPAPKKSWLDGFLERYFPHLANYLEQFEYAGIIRDLKKVHFAAMITSLEQGRPATIKQLVANGNLPPSFASEVTMGYRLTIHPVDAGAGVRVSAAPLDPQSGKRHFLIDEHSYVYSEAGRPATQKSPRFSSGYSIEVLPQ